MADYIRDASVPVVRGRVAEKPLEEGWEEVLGVGAHEVPPEGLQGRRSERQRETDRVKGGLKGFEDYEGKFHSSGLVLSEESVLAGWEKGFVNI